MTAMSTTGSARIANGLVSVSVLNLSIAMLYSLVFLGLDMKILIPTSDVEISTPLATVDADEKHLIYVDKSSPPKIKDLVGGKTVDVADFYPGTRLAALSVNGEVTVFYKLLNPAGAIATKLYDGSSWKNGTTVVPA
jgi:hypothetical protein